MKKTCCICDKKIKIYCRIFDENNSSKDSVCLDCLNDILNVFPITEIKISVCKFTFIDFIKCFFQIPYCVYELTFYKLTESVSKITKQIEDKKTIDPQIKCLNCGLTDLELIKNKKVGCEKCYDYFYPTFLIFFEKTQYDTIHKGKIPKKNLM